MSELNPLSVVKSNGFAYRVLTRFTITGAVYKRLMALSESHYDGKCCSPSLSSKSASRGGDNQGFITAWGRRLVFEHWQEGMGDFSDREAIPDEWTVEITCDNDELSIVAKIGEMEGYAFRNDPYGIHFSFMQLLKAAIEEYKRLNSISTHALMNATER